MDGKEIDGNKITCCRAQKKAERANELKNKFEAQKIERISRYQGRCHQNLSLRFHIGITPKTSSAK